MTRALLSRAAYTRGGGGGGTVGFQKQEYLQHISKQEDHIGPV